MSKRGSVFVFISVLLLSLVLAGNALAAGGGGNGTKDHPYLVDRSAVALSSPKDAGDYYVTLDKLHSTDGRDYASNRPASVSYATVRFYGGIGGDVLSLYINGGQYVDLNVSLNGLSVINNGTLTNNVAGSSIWGDSSATAVLVAKEDAYVSGRFISLTTAEDVHVTLEGDTEALAGNAGIIGLTTDAAVTPRAAALYTLSLGGKIGEVPTAPKAHIQGSFKQVNVSSGTVTDCDHGSEHPKVNITSEGVCLNISGGEVELDNGGTIKSSNGDAVNIYGGECRLLKGTVEVTNPSAYGVYVLGASSKFRFGSEETYAYNDDEFAANTPKIYAIGDRSSCIAIVDSGEAWLHAGEIYCEGENSIGVNVQEDYGVCHVYANDQYGTKAVSGGPRLYIHGGDTAQAAMRVGPSTMFDIRGRGVLFEQQENNGGDQYALYIDSTAQAASDYPLSGGAFNGKVYYNGDLSELMAYNHYLRYDGAAANYGYSDGTYGVDGTYTDSFGKYGEYYTITDAEWELRQQMAVENGSYQLPAGIVRGGGNKRDGYVTNCLTLDINIFAENNTEYTPYWGMGKRMGDVNVDGTGHTLYLAGRTLTYTGKNWAGTPHTDSTMSEVKYDVTDIPGDYYQTLGIKAGGELSIRDCVPGGGDIGTGKVAYEWVNNYDTCAIGVSGRLDVGRLNVGRLNVYSGRIEAVQGEGIRAEQGSVVAVSGTPYISSFYNEGGDAALSGGVYRRIKTVKKGEKLSDIISVPVKDNADAEARAATASSVEVADYVLENGTTLAEGEYAVNADGVKAIYDAPFVLVPRSVIILPPVEKKQVEIITPGGSVRAGDYSSEDAGDGQQRIEAVISGGELKKSGVEDIMTAVVVEPDGSLRHVPTVVKRNADGGLTVSFKAPAGAKFALESEKKSFADAKGRWYEAAANEMASRHILEGRSDDVFDGEAPITRAEFAALILRALGLPEDGDASAFTDVPKTAWYFGAVGKALEYKLVEGRDGGVFDPDAGISRQEAMAMLARAAKIADFAGTASELTAFSDADMVSGWALDYAKFSVGSGLVVGDGGLLRPLDGITRGESAAAALRLLQNAALIDVRAKV